MGQQPSVEVVCDRRRLAAHFSDQLHRRTGFPQHASTTSTSEKSNLGPKLGLEAHAAMAKSSRRGRMMRGE
jgi:hypothetical protein